MFKLLKKKEKPQFVRILHKDGSVIININHIRDILINEDSQEIDIRTDARDTKFGTTDADYFNYVRNYMLKTIGLK